MTETIDAAALDLARYLRAGDRIVLGQGCGEPTTLVEALIAQGRGIGRLQAFIASSFSGLFMPETAGSFTLTSMGAIGRLRAMTKANRLQVIRQSRCAEQDRARAIGAGDHPGAARSISSSPNTARRNCAGRRWPSGRGG